MQDNLQNTPADNALHCRYRKPVPLRFPDPAVSGILPLSLLCQFHMQTSVSDFPEEGRIHCIPPAYCSVSAAPPLYSFRKKQDFLLLPDSRPPSHYSYPYNSRTTHSLRSGQGFLPPHRPESSPPGFRSRWAGSLPSVPHFFHTKASFPSSLFLSSLRCFFRHAEYPSALPS